MSNSMQLYRDKLLTIHKTMAWTVLPAEELALAYKQTQLLIDSGEGIDDVQYTSLLELLFYLCIVVGEDAKAETLYKSLTDRFGDDSPRLHLMQATLLQVNSSDDAAKKYIEELLSKQLEVSTDSEDYVQMKKKLLTLDRANLSRQKWVQSLLDLVEQFPLDAELWSLLSQEYYEAGDISQAIYCMEEVIISVPFNYEAFGDLSRLLYLKSQTEKDPESLQCSLQNALRSVELAESYVKGWGLVLTTSSRLEKQQLYQLARSKLKQLQSSNGNDEISTISKFLLTV